MSSSLKVFVLFGLIVCLKGDGIGRPCMDNIACMNIVDAECSNGICNCIPGTVEYKGSCLQASEPEKMCLTNLDCKELDDVRRICVAGQCRCIPLHHVVEGMCMRNKGLRELCNSDDECYWGQNMEDRMECSYNVCSCKAGYRPLNKRQCIPVATRYLPRAFDAVLDWFN